MDNASSGSSWLSSLSPWSWTAADAGDEQVPAQLRPEHCFLLVCHYDSYTLAQHTGKPLSGSLLALCTVQGLFMQDRLHLLPAVEASSS